MRIKDNYSFDKVNEEINKLCQKISTKIIIHKGQINLLLIEFANEYNKIWNNISEKVAEEKN